MMLDNIGGLNMLVPFICMGRARKVFRHLHFNNSSARKFPQRCMKYKMQYAMVRRDSRFHGGRYQYVIGCSSSTQLRIPRNATEFRRSFSRMSVVKWIGYEVPTDNKICRMTWIDQAHRNVVREPSNKRENRDRALERFFYFSSK